MSFTPYGSGGVGPGSSGTSITVTSRLSATAGDSNITLDLPGVGTAGSYNSVTVDAYGRITNGQFLGYVTSSGTSMTPASAISFTVGASNVTLDLSATGVAAGSYNSVTVDSRGRVTSAQQLGYVTSSGTSLTGTSAISMTVGASNVTLDLSVTGVVAGSSYNSVTVDARGRITNAQTVAGGSGAPSDVSYLILGPADATLTKERLFVTGSGLTAQDGGAGSTYTIRTFPYYSSCSLSDDTGRVSPTLDSSLLSCAVLNGKLYRFLSHLIFRTAATTTGLRCGVTTPTFTILAGTGEIPAAAGGTGGVYHSYITASGVSVTGTGVALAGVNYLGRLFGTILPSSDGTLTVQFASEINASRVSLMAGSHMELWQLT